MTEIPQEILETGVLLDPERIATDGGVLLNVPRDMRVELAEALQEGAAEVPPHLRGATEIVAPTDDDFLDKLEARGAVPFDFPDDEEEQATAEAEPDIVIAESLTRYMFEETGNTDLLRQVAQLQP